MAENTKIQWCSHTFNGWVGCTKVAEGCKFCYAETLMDTRYGRVQWGPNGTRSMTKTWRDPLTWDRAAEKAGERRKVFCSSLCDVFEDWQGPIMDSQGRQLHFNSHANWTGDNVTWTPMTQPGTSSRPLTMDDLRLRMFNLIDRCPNLDFLLLTKRPENIRRMWQGPNRANVWLGTSVANQKNLDEYLPRLLSARGLAPILFLSIEPQIGRIDLSRFLFPTPTVQWVIVGGESKQGQGDPRPFCVDWARLIVQQCREAYVPCFVKQLGSDPYEDMQHSYVIPGRLHLKMADSHGGNWEEWPSELRVRQCPEGFYPQLVTEEVRR